MHLCTWGACRAATQTTYSKLTNMNDAPDDIEEDPFSGLDLPTDHAPLRMRSPPRQQLGGDADADVAADDVRAASRAVSQV